LSPATPIITLGAPLIELSSIDSTNIYAISQVQQQMAISGSCYRADFQTHGKGQFGKLWGSEKGENLLCSYVLNLNELENTFKKGQKWTQNDQIGLSIAVSIGVYRFFKAIAGDETSIKWPNDLYWRDRKAGGILIENTLRGTEWTWAVIGIGININQTQFDATIGKPVSLRQITGKEWEINQLLKDLSQALTVSINGWLQNGITLLLEDYNQGLFRKGKKVMFNNKEQGDFEATVMGVNEKGQLILDCGSIQTYNFGDLHWKI
jgi:BirA family biotin operon repressor/biotin-[acetyl-CoA-carboxylase] ligase